MRDADVTGVQTCALPIYYLERIGYYRLSGYWYSFRRFEESENGPKKRADSFFEGSHFEDAVKLYVFDKKLRLLDRKSTRLNSSHVRISYAVFCLKKKKIK